MAAMLHLLAIATVFSPSVVLHGDLDDRIATVTERLQQTPARVELVVQRAELHRLHDDPEACRTDLDRASALAPAFPPLLLTQARLEFDLHGFQASLEIVQSLLEKEELEQGLRLDAMLLHARVLTALDKRNAAVAAWTSLLAKHPNPAPDWYLAKSRLQPPAVALADLEVAMQRLGNALPLVLRASALEEQLGNAEAACARLDPVLKASPRKETWLGRQGDILQRGGLHTRALEKFQEARAQLDLLPPRHRNTFSMQRLAEHLDRSIAALTR